MPINIAKLKGKVEYVLQQFPPTRNNDMALTLRLWAQFYSHLMVRETPHGSQLEPTEWTVSLRTIMQLPREDQVSRIRRKFQEEGLYLPTDPEVLKKRRLLVRRESQTEPPNYFLRDLKSEELEQKTFFPNPTPQLEGITKEMITYERSDGVALTGTLYLPAGYDQERDGPLPVLMWAYPTEFKSKQDAGQVTALEAAQDRAVLSPAQGHVVGRIPVHEAVGDLEGGALGKLNLESELALSKGWNQIDTEARYQGDGARQGDGGGGDDLQQGHPEAAHEHR